MKSFCEICYCNQCMCLPEQANVEALLRFGWVSVEIWLAWEIVGFWRQMSAVVCLLA